jgi:16S rRNA (uracil1498-N3)-methyltransferase
VAHFYLSPTVTDAVVGSLVTVTDSEARHAVAAGRLRAGERLSLGDGAGTVVTGTVSRVEVGSFSVEVEESRFEEAPRPALWLAQALAKNDRDELAVQVATELGVDGVIPWAAGRSIVKWEGAKRARHEERWASILREASKQSMRSRIPELRPLASTAQLAHAGEELRILVLDPGAPDRLSALELDGRDLLLVVGPEGGIAPAELERLGAAGASRVSLGDTVLRTSTAGPAAIAVLNHLLGRW